MVTFGDCIHFSNLTSAEVDAIAEHEHIDDVIACELGSELVCSKRGCRTIVRYIEDDIEVAARHHNAMRLAHLHRVLDNFSSSHTYL